MAGDNALEKRVKELERQLSRLKEDIDLIAQETGVSIALASERKHREEQQKTRGAETARRYSEATRAASEVARRRQR